jgi:hypothetical protein
MSNLQRAFNQNQAYLKDQGLLEEVRQTHKLMINRNTRGEVVGYTINILMKFGSKYRWFKVASGTSRIRMTTLYKELIKKVVHNRMVQDTWDMGD